MRYRGINIVGWPSILGVLDILGRLIGQRAYLMYNQKFPGKPQQNQIMSEENYRVVSRPQRANNFPSTHLTNPIWLYSTRKLAASQKKLSRSLVKFSTMPTVSEIKFLQRNGLLTPPGNACRRGKSWQGNICLNDENFNDLDFTLAARQGTFFQSRRNPAADTRKRLLKNTNKELLPQLAQVVAPQKVSTRRKRKKSRKRKLLRT